MKHTLRNEIIGSNDVSDLIDISFLMKLPLKKLNSTAIKFLNFISPVLARSGTYSITEG